MAPPQNQQGQQGQQRPPPLPRQLSRLSQVSKQSFRSHSSSFEADDERSPSTEAGSADTDHDLEAMTSSSLINSNLAGSPGPPARYPGEDTRPTSPKELRGWYMYAFAAETYVICAISSFIPILLESLARENGVLLSNGKPCGPSNDKHSEDGGQCIIHVLGMEINTASFAMYSFSISVLLQALLVVSISSAADHGNYRKKLLLGFAWIGSGCVMLYLFVSSRVYLLGALLAIVSNTAFGASFVLLNSFLPLLVRHHPRAKYAEASPAAAAAAGGDLVATEAESQPLADSHVEGGLDDVFDESTTNLLPNDSRPAQNGQNGLAGVRTHEEKTSVELQLATEISAKGIGIGYAAALFVQCMSILLLLKMGSGTWSLRVVVFLIGTWWAVFTVPAAFWLRPRPGPPLPAKDTRTRMRALISYTAYAWKSLFRTMQLARRLTDIVLFLASWFLLSDAIATTSSTAILFAKTTLHMDPWALGLINVISTTAGIAGALSWSYVSRRYGLKPHQTILACIALFELIPLYGLVGYFPFVRRWGVVGLQQAWEMYPLALVYGLVLGGLSSYCRALYGELIPPGSEAAFYALYAITDKGSSVFGPFVVAAIIDATGEIRPAFWFLACLVGFPAPLVWFVDARRGKLEGERMAGVIEGFKRHHGPGDDAEDQGDSETRALWAAYDEEGDGVAAERR